MSITWNGKVYRVCLDTSGRIVVITSTGPRSSRVAEAVRLGNIVEATP
jgi:hypothetical protein